MTHFVPAPPRVKELAALVIEISRGYTPTEFLGALAIAAAVYVKYQFPQSPVRIMGEHKRNLDMALRNMEDQG